MAKKSDNTMKTQEFIRSVMDKLQSNANVKTVYGDPVETQEKTIIPVARIAYGFGGGFGEGHKDRKETAADDLGGEGGGGGSGLMVRPIGVVEVTKEKTEFVALRSNKKLLQAAAVGGVIALILRRLLRR